MATSLDKDCLFDLRNQIIMAETINREELEPIMVEAMQRYMGKFVPMYGYNWDIILNEVYPIVQTNLPAIFFRNPRAYLKPRNKTYIAKKLDPTTGKKVDTIMDSQKSANTQEAILNYSLERIKYKKETRKCLLDALLFPHAILWHGYKGDFGMTEEQSLWVKNDSVFIKRICPMRFIKDPNVNMSNLDEAKWVGRIIDIPLQDLVDDDQLDVDKSLIKGFKGYGEKVGTASINSAIATNGYQTGGGDTRPLNNLRKNLLDFTENGYKSSKHCNFVRLYEIFKRPTKKEQRKGDKGSIVLLTFEQPKPLRVNDWSIKAEGFPAQVLQFNDLPDAMLGMSDVDTYKTIADNKNIMTNLAIRNAQENSKLYVAVAKDGTDEESIEKIQRGDQTILLFDGDSINGKMSVQSGAGAASSELYQCINYIQKNLDDKSGVTDLRRGVLQSGEESALSVKIRAGSSSARPAYRQDLMTDFLKGSLEYINQLNRQFVPFDEAVRIVGSLDLQWSDKPSTEEVQAEVDVEIDPISMLPESPEDEAMHLQQILQLMVQGLNDPAVAQKIAQEGYTINLSPIIQQLLSRLKIKDPEIFRSIKPEESMGFASVQQLKLAQANVEAIMHAQPIPNPPQPTDDHNAQLGVYQPILQLLQEAGQQQTHAFQELAQLIQIQSALLQQALDSQPTPGQQVKPNKPFMSKS